MTIRKADDRGTTKISWLDSRHTFSFNQYYDERFMGFRTLRVINDDRVKPGGAFGLHGHRDMEILTMVLDGALRHGDSLGHVQLLVPGEVQRMSAGTGIRHSEANASDDAPVHFLQIWIEPERNGLPPAYSQKAFPLEARQNRWVRVAGKCETDRDGALHIHQDTDVLVATTEPGAQLQYTLRPGRAAWIHLATGEATVNGMLLQAGDAAALEDEPILKVQSSNGPAQLVLFDLA